MTAEGKLNDIKIGTKIKTVSGKVFTVISLYISGTSLKHRGFLNSNFEIERCISEHILCKYPWETQFTIIKDEVHVLN